MPRIETSLDSITKSAFHDLATRSGTTEAALLRRVIATLVKTNPGGPTGQQAQDRRSLRLTVRVTPDVFAAVSQAARSAGISRPGIVLGTLRARFLEAPTLLPIEAEAVASAAYQLAMVGTNLNQLARALNRGHFDSLPGCGPVVANATTAVDVLRDQIRRLSENATTRWVPKESGE